MISFACCQIIWMSRENNLRLYDFSVGIGRDIVSWDYDAGTTSIGDTSHVGNTNTLQVYGTASISNTPAKGSPADTILVKGALGQVNYRTAAQLLSDAGGAPASGSANYIQNTTSPQSSSNFNISNAGVIGTSLTVGNGLTVTTGAIALTPSSFRVGSATANDAQRLNLKASNNSYMLGFESADGVDRGGYYWNGSKMVADNSDGWTFAGPLAASSTLNVTSTITATTLAGTGSRAVFSDANGDLSAPVSDSSVKNRVKPLEYGVNELMKLRPVSYYYNKDFQNFGKTRQIGFIAQEVEKVLPNSVFVNESGQLKGKKGYNKEDLIPILVKAVQEQQIQIEKQNKRISALEKQLKLK